MLNIQYFMSNSGLRVPEAGWDPGRLGPGPEPMGPGAVGPGPVGPGARASGTRAICKQTHATITRKTFMVLLQMC